MARPVGNSSSTTAPRIHLGAMPPPLAPPALQARPPESAGLPSPALGMERLRFLSRQLEEDFPLADAEQALRLFDQLHQDRSVIEDCIRSNSQQGAYHQFQKNLTRFLRDVVESVQDGRLKLNTLVNIERVALGLASCTHGGTSAFGDDIRKYLSPLTQQISNALHGQFHGEACKAPGQYLNIHNWIAHAIKAGIVDVDASTRARSRNSLQTFLAWARKPELFPMDAHNLGKCAIQIELLCHPDHQLLDLQDAQTVSDLKALMDWMCSSTNAAILFKPAVDVVPLANVFTLLRRMLSLKPLVDGQANLPDALDRLITPLATLSIQTLHAGDARAPVRLSNFLRQLIQFKVDAGLSPEMAGRWAASLANLLNSCSAASFATLAATAQDLAHLLNLLRACHGWRARSQVQTVLDALPAPAQLHVLCGTLLQRLGPDALRVSSDGALARNLVDFLCWARENTMTPAGDLDPCLHALLENAASRGGAWSGDIRNDVLHHLQGLLQSGCQDSLLQPAVQALKRPPGDNSSSGGNTAPRDTSQAEPEDDFVPANKPVKAMPPTQQALAILAAFQDAPDDDSDLEEAGPPAPPTALHPTALHGPLASAIKPAALTIDQQLASVNDDYTLRAQTYTPSDRAVQREKRIAMTSLQLAVMEATRKPPTPSVKPAPAAPAQAIEDIKRALFLRLYEKLLDYLASDNVDKLTELLAMNDGPTVFAHRDANGRTVLQIALARDARKLVSMLFDRPDLREAVHAQALLADRAGNTPLMMAAWRGNLAAIDALLQVPGVAARILATRKNADLAVTMKRFIGHQAMLLQEANTGRVLALEPDPFVDASEGPEMDALHVAVRSGQAGSARALLEHPEVLRKIGRNPQYADALLMRMSMHVSVDMIQALMSVEALRAAANAHSGIALASIISAGQTDCVAELLKFIDAKAMLKRRLQTPVGHMTLFDVARRHGPVEKRQAMQEVLLAAWNRSSNASSTQ